MDNKRRQILWVLVGGYLAYLGITLIRSSLANKPEFYIAFIVCAIIFIAVGAFLIARAIKIMMAPDVEGDNISEEEETGELSDDNETEDTLTAIETETTPDITAEDVQKEEAKTESEE